MKMPVWIFSLLLAISAASHAQTTPSDDYIVALVNSEPITQAELQTYVDKLNNRPRKKLGYRTPAQVFKAGSVALRV